MAKTISDLNSVTSLADDNLMIVRQGTVDKKTSMTQVVDYIKSEPITFSSDITVEGTFSLSTNQKTAFNRDFGTIAGTVSEGNHLHPSYLTGITKSQIEAQLTGEISSHSHSQASIQNSVQGMNFTVEPTINSKRIVTVASGTVFPSSPGLGDECYRTDLDEWYKYNGAIWMQI